MSTLTNFEVYASRLRDSSIVVKLKYTIALELCESLEFFQPHDTPAFMNILWPAIREYLLNNPPVFISASPEHKLRSTLIDTVRRVPLSESLRDYAPDLANTFLELAKIEDEENAVVCLKIIYDLHRMYYTKLDNFAKPFFEMAFELYGNAGRIAEAAREASEVPSSGAPPAST
ncbi:transcription-associated protein 1, partial [Spiromyces aspiralis]